MPPKKNYKKRFFKKRGFKKGTTRKTVSTAVKKYVKSTIHKQIENKCIQINQSQSFGSITESPDFNAFPMAPQSAFWTISQGIGQGGRIGNQLKIRKVLLSYILRPAPYDISSNPFPSPVEVQMMLGYVRQTPSTVPVAADINQIFQSGSSVTAPVGILRDIITPINNDYWVIKKRWTHKVGYSNNNGTGGVNGQQYNANNDFKLNVKKTINITGLLPTTMKFNDGSASTLSRNLYFMFYGVSANGNASSTSATAVIEYWIDFHYEDA